VTAGLRCLHDAKGILASWYWYVGGIVTRDLQKHPAVRATLIRLPGRVQEAWPVPQTRRHLFGITHGQADGLQWLLVRVIHLDVGRDTAIVSRSQAAEVCLEIGRQRFRAPSRARQRRGIYVIREEFNAISLENRYLGWKRATLLILRCQLARGNLAGFHVRLVKGVNANDRPCDCRGDLPTKHFFAELIRISNRNTHHRLTGRF